MYCSLLLFAPTIFYVFSFTPNLKIQFYVHLPFAFFIFLSFYFPTLFIFVYKIPKPLIILLLQVMKEENVIYVWLLFAIPILLFSFYTSNKNVILCLVGFCYFPIFIIFFYILTYFYYLIIALLIVTFCSLPFFKFYFLSYSKI